MKFLYPVTGIALTLLFTRSSRAISQDDLDAFKEFGSVPCPEDMRKYFHNCPEGPNCYDCMDGGQKQCYAAFSSPRNIDCTDCVFRARFIYCKVNPLNATEKIPDDFPIPEAFRNSDAFKGKLNSTGTSTNSTTPGAPAATPASNTTSSDPNSSAPAANSSPSGSPAAADSSSPPAASPSPAATT